MSVKGWADENTTSNDPDCVDTQNYTDAQNILEFLPVTNGIATKIFNLTCSNQSSVGLSSGTGEYNVSEANCAVLVSLVIKANAVPPKVAVISTSPANPEPILWDPKAGAKIPLSVTFSSTQGGKADASLLIYDDQGNLVQTIVQSGQKLNDTMPTTINFVWDGMTASNSGVPAKQGVYTFEFRVSSSNSTNASDKSWFMSTQQPFGPVAAIYNPIDVTNDPALTFFTIPYTITPLDSTKSGNAGKIELYDPQGRLVPLKDSKGHPAADGITIPLGADDLKSGSHSLIVSVPKQAFSYWGNYTFLVSVQDGNAIHNDSGANLWARPCCLPVPFKQVALTDPVDNVGDIITKIPGPMLFRGISEADTRLYPEDDSGMRHQNHPPGNIQSFPDPPPPGANNKATSCPIVIRGFVLPGGTGHQEETPVLTFSFERVTLNANGTWTNSDGTKSRNAPNDYYAEKAINPAQLGRVLVGAYDPVKGYPFQVVWNQRLPRTSVTVDPTTNMTVASSQRWVVRAYAIYNEAAPTKPAGSPSASPNPATDRQFRVMGMADPIKPANIVSGYYNDATNPRTGTVWLFAKDSNGNRFTLPFTSKGLHLAWDYDATPNTVIGSAEFGIVQERQDEDPKFNAPPASITDATITQIEMAVNQWLTNHGHQTMDQADLSTGYPWNYLTVSLTGNTADDRYIFGPNRDINHGLVNLNLSKDFVATLKDSTLPAVLSGSLYDQNEVVTKYCHIQPAADGITPLTPPAVGDFVSKSSPIAKVGETIALLPVNINQIFDPNNGYYDPPKLLGRGYFTLIGAHLVITPNDGSAAILDIPQVTLSFPSITGPHLHFEVHLPKPVNVKGEQDPMQWILH